MAQQQITPFSEYRPDVSDYQGSTSKDITNVVAHGDGYGPFASLAPYTAALPAQCRGFFFARNADGSISVFAGTSTKLYELNNTNQTWTDVSKSGGTYSALGSTANWQFVQFNNLVFATQVNAPLQVFDLTSSSAFSDSLGSPPQAAYIAVVNRFLVLSGLSSNVYTIQWSGLNDVNSSTSWTSGINSSDSQALADGGIVRGVSGGEYGVIFQDSSIRSMIYAPGSPYVFGIERISLDDGMFAPYSLIRSGDKLFWYSPQGFKVMPPGGSPTSIGKERVDRTFIADLDTGNLQLFIGANDPTQTRVYWAYKSVNGTTGQFDKVLCYDWALDKWTLLKFAGEYLASLSKPGITLEGVDAAFGSNIDTLTIPSLDSISNASITSLAGMTAMNALGFFTGSNLEATLETPKHGDGGRRIFVRGFRAVSDATSIFCSVSQRESPQSAYTYSAESQIDSRGFAPQRVSTRYGRGKFRIPVGTTWTYAAGIEPDISLEGER